jgi:hypothetical protein
MLRKLVFGAMVCASGVAFAAPDAKDDLTAAAKKLADASNYSWKQTTESGNFNTSQEGKTEKAGLTSLNITFGDNTIQVIKKGEKAAIKTEDGWKTAEEMAANNDGQPNIGRFIGPMVQQMKAPGAQAEEYISKLKEIKKDDDAYTSELTGAEAASLAPRRGGRRGGGGGAGAAPPPMQNAKVSLKMWVKDGVLSKYTMHVTGTMTFNGEDRDIDTTTTTEISDVGSTKIEVPDDAKKKLE